MVDGQVLSDLLQEKLNCKFKRVRVYDGPLAQKDPSYFKNFCDGIGKGVVNGSSSIQFSTADLGFGGAPPIPGVGVGVGIVMDTDYFTEQLYKELRQRIVQLHNQTIHPEWCSEPFTYNTLVGTWRKEENHDTGVDVSFNGSSYTITGYGDNGSAGKGSYSWEPATGALNRCESGGTGWNFPSAKSVRLLVRGNVLQIYSDTELYDTFSRTTPAPGIAPPGHCSLKPNQYNKYNFLTALCEGISESISEHYEAFRDLNSAHPTVYAGEGEIKNGMYFGVVESEVASMIVTEGSMMKGSFWIEMAQAVAKVYTDTVHNKSTGVVTITGSCTPSSHQACGIPMIGIGSGMAT